MFREFGDFLERISERAARSIYRISLLVVLVMMLLTVYDVVARYFFNRPLIGAYEFTEFLLVIMVTSALAFAQVSKRHISVELLVSGLPLRARKITHVISCSICLSIYVLIAWQGFKGAQTQWRHGIVSGAFSVPLWPFYLFLAFGCSVLCLVFLADLLKVLRGKEDGL